MKADYRGKTAPTDGCKLLAALKKLSGSSKVKSGTGCNVMNIVPSQPDPLDTIERTLRSVIHDVLSDRFGPNWTQDENAGLGSSWSGELVEKAREDQGVQAPNVVYDVPLAYAEFRDLGELLRKHRNLFRPIFRDWKIILAHFHAAEKLRNAIQHNRDIGPTQQSLLVGIAGEIQDAVNLWRIGTPLRTKRTVLQFRDEISAQDKSEAQILKGAAEYVSQWRGRILDAIQASSLDPNWATNVENEEFKYSIRVQHIEASIEAHSSYKDFDAELKYRPAFRYPDEFLEAIGKPYYLIAYELEDRLDVKALKRWSAERAGLSPSSSQTFNQELTSIDYSLFRGRLRISAQKYVERTSDSGGKLSAIVEPPAGFWRAHNLIGPEQLIGFMVGDITPKAMMHLVQTSLLS